MIVSGLVSVSLMGNGSSPCRWAVDIPRRAEMHEGLAQEIKLVSGRLWERSFLWSR